MNFGFGLSEVFSIDGQGFAILRSNELPKTFLYWQTQSRCITREERMARVVDDMGVASSRSQGLPTTITSISKLSISVQTLYLRVHENKAIGFIKVGYKNLCYRDLRGKCLELKPLCVLDFYVHESYQRHGYGKEIFEKMLKEEGVTPGKLAIDKPSFKFISFLKKYYGLSHFIPQNNNFVIFDQFFTQTKQIRPESQEGLLALSNIGDRRSSIPQTNVC